MTATPATASDPAGGGGLSRRMKILIGVSIYILIGVLLGDTRTALVAAGLLAAGLLGKRLLLASR